jgi:hypothetical protein
MLTHFFRASAMYDEKPTLTKDEWISVLKLSTRWLFNDLRKLAITHLSATQMDAMDRISLAKEYRVYDWLLRGYEQVTYRLLTFNATAVGSKTTLTAEEGRLIGMDAALELSGVVIRRMRWKEGNGLWKDPKEDILDAFKDEFCCVRRDEARFMTRSEHMQEEAERQKVAEDQQTGQVKEERERHALENEEASTVGREANVV